MSSLTSPIGTVWKPIGPSPIEEEGCCAPYTFQANGRANAIAVNPNNSNVIYLGAAGGGVWKSIDRGGSWIPLTDHQVSLGTGTPRAIAIDPTNTNTIYVGTSSFALLAQSLPRANDATQSRGILKSTDGGATWIELGSGFPSGNNGNARSLFLRKSITSIIVDPADGRVLYLSAGRPGDPVSGGLFRSTDSGQNWTEDPNVGGVMAESLALDASSPLGSRVLYAGVAGIGVLKSANGGQSWDPVLTPATPAVFAVDPKGFGKVKVALAPPATPPNPAGEVIYVTLASNSTRAELFFENTNGGASGSWVQKNAMVVGPTVLSPPTLTASGFSDLIVDQTSPGDGATDVIYWGTGTQFRSSNSGDTFNEIGEINGIHGDTQTFFVVPGATPLSSTIYAGDDGGLWRSEDQGATWTGTGLTPSPPTLQTLNASGLQTATFYALAIKQDATAGVTLGGTQDSGIVRGCAPISASCPKPIPLWNGPSAVGGDGIDVAFDKVVPGTAYAIHNCSCLGNPNRPCDCLSRSSDSGLSWTDITANTGMPDAELSIFSNRLRTDPGKAGALYVGGSAGSVFQTMDGGATFRSLGTPAPGFYITSLDVAPANSNNLVIAASDGRVFVTTNALASTIGCPSGVCFRNITTGLPSRFVTRVAFDPVEPTVVYATLAGFDGDTPGKPGHVFRRTLGGSWIDISPPVDIPVNAIILDGAALPPAIFVGTDLGVMRSVDGGAGWTVLDDVHLPNAAVSSMDLNSQAGVLRVATFGRGVFELAQPTGPVISINAENGLEFGSVCPGSPTFLTIQVFNVGTADLVVNSVQRILGDNQFVVLPNPSTPLVISPNSEVDFTVRFTPPISPGSYAAKIRISSNDPGAPVFDLMATATVGSPVLDTLIADNGSFGEVCRGTFKDLALTLNNSGACDLSVSGISSSSGEFQVASAMSYPMVVGPGDSLQIPIRLAPTTLGAKSANITITSNDPASPKVVAVTGSTPPGDIRLTGSSSFGDVCAGAIAEKAVSVCNVGKCDLHVTSAAFSPACADFTLVNSPFPATVSHDSCNDLVIRFTPTSMGPKSCTLVITSDDPDTLVISLPVTANTPTPSIDIPPDQGFPATVIQSVGACTTAQTFPVSNTGICPLTITGFGITDNPAEFSILGLPSMPIILQAGHIAGEGNLNNVSTPNVLDRDRTGQLTITYLSEPITGSTTTVTRALCGEGVRTGARVLVTSGGLPLANVEQIKLSRLNANRNKNLLDTVDNARNLALQTVMPASPCTPFRFHREYATVSNPIQLAPGSYQVAATAIVNGKRMRKTVGFDVNTCGFNANIVINF